MIITIIITRSLAFIMHILSIIPTCHRQIVLASSRCFADAKPQTNLAIITYMALSLRARNPSDCQPYSHIRPLNLIITTTTTTDIYPWNDAWLTGHGCHTGCSWWMLFVYPHPIAPRIVHIVFASDAKAKWWCVWPYNATRRTNYSHLELRRTSTVHVVERLFRIKLILYIADIMVWWVRIVNDSEW